MNKEVINQLNTFLKGNFIAARAYEQFIQYAENKEVKKVLQVIQQNHKKHAIAVATRIQDLGGIPIKDAGMVEFMAEWMSKMKSTQKPDIAIVGEALISERRGIEKSKALLAGNLDANSLEMIQEILNSDEEHLELLAKFAPA